MNTSFSTPGKARQGASCIRHQCLKKNVALLIVASHPTVKYVGTTSTSYQLQAMNKVRKALSIGGPTFIQCLKTCPKSWDFDPAIACEPGELAVNTSIWPLNEVENGKPSVYGKTEQIAKGKFKRLRVRDYLLRQGRFAHFTDEDIAYFQI